MAHAARLPDCAHFPDEIEQLNHGGGEHVVETRVGCELLHEREQAVVLGDVPVVKLIAQTNARAHKAYGCKDERLVAQRAEAEHLGHHVVLEHKVLDPIACVVRERGEEEGM